MHITDPQTPSRSKETPVGLIDQASPKPDQQLSPLLSRVQRLAYQHSRLISGVTLAATVTGGWQLTHLLSPYEGEFELSPGHDTLQNQVTTASPSGLVSEHSVVSEEQTEVLFSPQKIASVIQAIQNNDPSFTQDALLQNLEIAKTASGHLIIRYRDSKAEQAEAVLQALAQAYTHDSSHCDISLCQELIALDAKINQLRQEIVTTSTQIQRFEEHSSGYQIAIHKNLLSQREQTLFRQKDEIDQILRSTNQQLSDLNIALSLAQKKQIAEKILASSDIYQSHWQNLKELENAMASELGALNPNQAQLKQLYTQFEQISQELDSIVVALPQRSTTQAFALSITYDIVTDETLPNLLEQNVLSSLLIETYQIERLQLRQQTILKIESLLHQHTDQINQLSRQYDGWKQSLQSANQNLKNALAQREQLLQQAPPAQFAWTLMGKPEEITVVPVSPWVNLTQLPYNSQQLILLGLIIGGGLLSTIMSNPGLADSMQKDVYYWQLAT